MTLRHLVLLCCVLSGGSQAATINCVIEEKQRWVSYVGGVDMADPPIFRREFSRCFDNVKVPIPVVRLSSNGGAVSAGLEMADFLANVGDRRGVRVEVAPEARCISACTFLFIAGSHRFAPAGSKLEPHGFSSLSGNNPEHNKARNWADPDLEQRPHISLGRLKLAASPIALQFAAEQRDPSGLLAIEACRTVPQCQAAFVNLEPATRALLTEWDGIVRTRYIDLERITALAVMYERGQFGDPQISRIDNGVAQITSVLFPDVLDRHLGAKRLNRVDPAKSGAVERISQSLQQHLSNTASTAGNLWRLIKRKSNELDPKALVDLMFSTSILYTRPLTREEMCDANIVNVDC